MRLTSGLGSAKRGEAKNSDNTVASAEKNFIKTGIGNSSIFNNAPKRVAQPVILESIICLAMASIIAALYILQFMLKNQIN